MHKVDGNKGLGIQVFDKVFDLDILLPCYNGVDYRLFVLGVASFRIEDGRSSREFGQNKVVDLILVLGDDFKVDTGVEAGNRLVDDHGVHQNPQQGVEAELGSEGQTCHYGNQEVGQKQGLTHIDMGELVDNLSDNIGSSGRGILVEDQGVADTVDQDTVEKVDQEIIGNQASIGKEDLPKRNHTRQGKAGIDGISSKLLADKKEGKDKEDGVDHDHKQSRREGGDD